MTVPVTISRVMLATEHDNQKWICFKGEVEGVPAVTKTLTIAVASLVSRPSLLDEARSKLESDVREYHANWLALKEPTRSITMSAPITLSVPM